MTMRALFLLVFLAACGAAPVEGPSEFLELDAGASSLPASASSTPDAGATPLDECRALCPFAREVEIGPGGSCVCKI